MSSVLAKLKEIESRASTVLGVVESTPAQASAKELATFIREVIADIEGKEGADAEEKQPKQPKPPKETADAGKPGPVDTPNGGSAAPQVNANTDAKGPAVPTPPANAEAPAK